MDLAHLVDSPMAQVLAVLLAFMLSALGVAREVRNLKPATQSAHLLELQAAKEAADIYKARAEAYIDENTRLKAEIVAHKARIDDMKATVEKVTRDSQRSLDTIVHELADCQAALKAKDAALAELRSIVSPPVKISRPDGGER